MKTIYWLAALASGAMLWSWTKSSAAAQATTQTPSTAPAIPPSRPVTRVVQVEPAIWNGQRQIWSIGMDVYYTTAPDESPTYALLFIDDPNPSAPTTPTASQIQKAASFNWNFPAANVVAS